MDRAAPSIDDSLDASLLSPRSPRRDNAAANRTLIEAGGTAGLLAGAAFRTLSGHGHITILSELLDTGGELAGRISRP